MPAHPPTVEDVTAAVVRHMARWTINCMRILEENKADPSERWTILRQSFEQLGRDRDA